MCVYTCKRTGSFPRDKLSFIRFIYLAKKKPYISSFTRILLKYYFVNAENLQIKVCQY